MAVTFHCNKCGRKMDEYDIMAGLSLTTVLEFGSKHDGEKIHIDLCPECLEEFIDQCVIAPFVDMSGEFWVVRDD